MSARPGQRVSRAVVASLLGTAVVAQVLLLFTGLIGARLLGPEGRGELALAVMWPTVLVGLIELGLQTTYALQASREPGATRVMFGNGLVIAAMLTAVVTVAGVVIVLTVVPGPVRLASVLAFIQVPFAILRSPMWGMQRGLGSFGSFNASRLGALVPYLVVLIVLWVLGAPSVELATLGVVAGMVLSLGVSLWDLRDRMLPPAFDRARLQATLKTGLPIHLGNLATGEAVQTDLIFASLILTTTDLGFYAVGRSFMLLPSLVGNGFAIAALHEQATSVNQRTSRRIVEALLLTAPIVVLTAVVIPFIVPLLFGATFLPSVLPAEILLLAGFAVSLRRVVGDSLRARGNIGPAAATELVGLAVGIAIVVAGQPSPLLAVASATLAGQATILVLQAVLLAIPSIRRRLGGPDRHSFSRILLTVVSAFVLGLVLPFASDLGQMLIAGATLAVLGAFTVYLVSGADGVILVAFAAALFTVPWNAVRITEWMTLSDALFVLAAFFMLMSGHRGNPSVMRRTNPIVVGILVLVVAGLMGSWSTDDFTAGLANLVRFAVAAAALPLLITWWSPSRRPTRVAIWAWVLGAAVSSVAAILGLVAVTSPALGLATHYNALALTSVIATGACLGLFATGRHWERLATIGLVTVLFGAIYVSGSRAGLIGFVAVIAVFVLLSGNRAPAVALAGVGALVLSVAAGVITTPTADAVSRLLALDPASVANSNAERLVLFQSNLEIAWEHPLFGIGFVQALDAHNVLLQVLVSAGIVGLVAFLYVLGSILRPAIPTIVRGGGHEIDPGVRLMTVGLVSSLAGLLVAGLFQNALWDRYIWVVPGLLAAVAPPLAGALADRPAASSASASHRTASKLRHEGSME